MSGWSLVDVADGVQEWESPELLKDTFHRFASLAVQAPMRLATITGTEALPPPHVPRAC